MSSSNWFTPFPILETLPAGRAYVHDLGTPHWPMPTPLTTIDNNILGRVGVAEDEHALILLWVDQMVDHKEPTCHELG